MKSDSFRFPVDRVSVNPRIALLVLLKPSLISHFGAIAIAREIVKRTFGLSVKEDMRED